MRRYLMMLILGICLYYPNLRGQEGLQGIYISQLNDFLENQELNPRKIQGLPPEISPDLFALDTTNQLILYLQPPAITYNLLEKGKKLERKMSVYANWQDSVMHSQQIVFIDTLKKTVFRKLRKKSSATFKGENPSLWGRWLGPITGITVSVGAIISLFFLRSSPS